MEMLADYLKLVASNDTLFASYFWWRDYYEVQAEDLWESLRESWCGLCQYLHTVKEDGPIKHFDPEEHLNIAHNCRQPSHIST